jgi:outer membrane protein TolC
LPRPPRLGAARADLFPKFTITASQGGRKQLQRHPLGAGNFFFDRPAIQLPIFTGGRIRANIAVNDARLSRKRRPVTKAMSPRSKMWECVFATPAKRSA